MIWQVGEAGTNQAKERISGEMLASLRGNDRHGNPRLENLKSFQGEGYCRIDVYEKATGISRWLLGFVALRELLLLDVLGRHKAHGRTRHRFRDGLGIAAVVFMRLDVRLDAWRCHELHLVARRTEASRPVMRAATGF